METYRNYAPIAYPPTDKRVPVPGWDMRALLAGSPIIAIGSVPTMNQGGTPRGVIIYGGNGVAAKATPAQSFHGFGYDMVIQTPVGPQTISIPIEEMTNKVIGDALTTLWPQIQPKLKAELDAAVGEAKSEIRRDMVIGGVALMAVMIAVLKWNKQRI